MWDELAGQGWLGIHLPEELGGQGFGLFELAVLLEETAWSAFPGPLLPTVATSALLAGSLAPDEAARLVARAGRRHHGGGGGLRGGQARGRGPAGRRRAGGVGHAAPGAGCGHRRPGPRAGRRRRRRVLVPAGGGRRPPSGPPRSASLDPTRRVAAVEVDAATVPPGHQLRSLPAGRVRQVVVALLAAEHAGGARWCLETATEYAKVRVQFGRPIGQFQAVKHRLADMAVRVEQMASAAWDAALAVEAGDDADGAALADGHRRGAVCRGLRPVGQGVPAAAGGHRLHLGARPPPLPEAGAGRPGAAGRAPPPSPATWPTWRWGARAGRSTADLPEGADRLRAELAPVVAEVARAPRATSGAPVWSTPGWSPRTGRRPWGRDAARRGAGGARRGDGRRRGRPAPHRHRRLGPARPSSPAGTEEQRARWVRPTLLGELAWCQLFSEPGRRLRPGQPSRPGRCAPRGDGSSPARRCGRPWPTWPTCGICLARTDPDAPKHQGITYFVVDMTGPGPGDPAAPRAHRGRPVQRGLPRRGVRARRRVIGEVNGGWGIARLTLANERVSISSGATFGIGVESLVRLAAKAERAAPRRPAPRARAACWPRRSRSG